MDLHRIVRWLEAHTFPARIEGSEVVFEIPTHRAGQDGPPELHRVRTLTAAAIAIGY